MTAIARRHEISARRASRVERNLCLYVIIIIFELAGIYTDQNTFWQIKYWQISHPCIHIPLQDYW